MAGSAAPALAARDLRRVYARRGRGEEPVVALDRLSLTVEPGEVHGLLGPNGAGKSTLMKIWSTVLVPTSGRASVLGHDVVADYRTVRTQLGVVFGGERGLYPRLSGRENLRYWAALYRLDGATARRRTGELLDEFGLADRADDRVETYSTGMRQRLHLARGLIGSPRVLLLDEPTNGLDPVAGRDLQGVIRRLAEQGRTVVLATHDMAEAESVCDRVTMINHGRLVATSAPGALAGVAAPYEQIDVDGAPVGLLERVQLLPGVTEVVAVTEGTARISVDGRDSAALVLQRLVAGGAAAVRTARPSLEEIYLRLMRDGGPVPDNRADVP